MEWTDPDEETGYADQGEIETGAEVLLRRLERIRRLLWFGAPSVIVENEIRQLTEEHEKFAQGRRVLQ
jgi:hypothetical protein